MRSPTFHSTFCVAESPIYVFHRYATFIRPCLVCVTSFDDFCCQSATYWVWHSYTSQRQNSFFYVSIIAVHFVQARNRPRQRCHALHHAECPTEHTRTTLHSPVAGRCFVGILFGFQGESNTYSWHRFNTAKRNMNEYRNNWVSEKPLELS